MLDYFKILDKIGNSMGVVPVHLSRTSMVADAISTGSLTCDLIIGGGWPAGRWVTLFGPEASCKSTLLYHTLQDAIKQTSTITEFFDFEGSTDPTYLSKILNVDLTSVFGVRKENGVWQIAPKCRYHQPDLGEVYFRYMHRILKVIPDKLQHNGGWYYVYDEKPKTDFDPKLYKSTKRYWVPAPDGNAQIIWFIDSLPAMLTEKQDEKDENNEIGLQARMFSRYIPTVKSRLARKRCGIVAVNQIRMKPMCMFGSPEYEPCGEAPKFYSDIRLQVRSCSVPPPGKGPILEEPCWDGIGTDKYRYVKVSTRKNKCFSPFRSTLMRVWMEEKGDTGRGIDPVFDVYQYLVETGQVTVVKKAYIITLPGLWTQRPWSWIEFKELVLNPNKAEVYHKFNLNDPAVGAVDPSNQDAQAKLSTMLDIRQVCKAQIKSDEAFRLYFDAMCQGGKSSPKEEKTCGMCTKFHKDEMCMEVEADQAGCDQWKSEEQEEAELDLPEAIEE